MLLCRLKTYSEYYFSATDGDSIWISFTFFQCKIRGANPKMHKRSEMQLFIQADVGYMRQLHTYIVQAFSLAYKSLGKPFINAFLFIQKTCLKTYVNIFLCSPQRLFWISFLTPFQHKLHSG